MSMGARRLEGCGADGHFLDRLHLQRGFLKNASVLLFCCSLFCYVFCVGQGRPGRTRESHGKRFFVFRFLFFCILHFLFRPGKAGENQGRPAIFVFFSCFFVVGQGIPGSPSESQGDGGSPRDSLRVPGNPRKSLSLNSCNLSEK